MIANDKQFNSKRYSKQFTVTSPDIFRVNRVLEMIGQGKSVLDLGCGDGFLMKKIQAVGNSVEGIEVSTPAIRHARKQGLKVYDLSLNTPWAALIKKHYDAVFAGELIEHIYDTDMLLEEIRKVLKKNGSLIITTPNLASLGRRILLLLGKNPLIENTMRTNDAGHIRYFTKDTLIRLLHDNGFELLEYHSGVVNFDSSGKFYSLLLASLLPTLGNTLIIKAMKR